MSKAQFVVALRRCFGADFLKSETAISRLFDSFDIEHQDEMDWRSFLFLLTILMQPQQPQSEHLMYGKLIIF